MNKQYISIKEAIDKTGKSDASIRRLCRKGLKGKDYKYDVEGKLYLNDLFLYAYYPPQHRVDQMHMNFDYEKLKSLESEIEQFKDIIKNHPIDLMLEKDKRIIDLKREIDTKNITITNLSSTIEGLNNNIALLAERTREQNIIIQSLQEKISPQGNSSKNLQGRQIKEAKNIIFVDKILIGVAVLSSIAILAFISMMLFAYYNK